MVSIFPDRPSVFRLDGAVLMETSDEMDEGRRHFSLEPMRKLTTLDPTRVPEGAPLRLTPVPRGEKSRHSATQETYRICGT